MRVMLTSYSIGKYPSIFNRFPPLDIRASAKGLSPDYSLLVLCDNCILDNVSFELLMSRPGPLFKSTARMAKLLHDEGYLELADYSSIVNDHSELLDQMTRHDLESAVPWFKALKSSAVAWQHFARRASWPSNVDWEFKPTRNPEPLLKNYSQTETWEVASRRKSPKSKSWSIKGSKIAFTHTMLLREAYERGEVILAPHSLRHETLDASLLNVLTSYLNYVNANLILSRKLEAGIYDWTDFLPFYQRKFLSVGYHDTPVFKIAETSHQLFDIAFPEFSIGDPDHLLRLLKHRRVAELRTLITEASEGRVTFDNEFAKSVYREVFEIDEERIRRQRLIGYLTLPIGFIPLIGNFAQPAVQELLGTLTEKQLIKPYRWFYMVRDTVPKERFKASLKTNPDALRGSFRRGLDSPYVQSLPIKNSNRSIDLGGQKRIRSRQKRPKP
jgi:hypothetical protein